MVILLRLYRDYNKPFQGATHEPIRKNGMSGFWTVTTKIYDIFRFRNLNLNLLLILFATGILDSMGGGRVMQDITIPRVDEIWNWTISNFKQKMVDSNWVRKKTILLTFHCLFNRDAAYSMVCEIIPTSLGRISSPKNTLKTTRHPHIYPINNPPKYTPT